MGGNFPVHMYAESTSNISPNPQKLYLKFQNPWTTFEKIPPCPPESVIVPVVGGGPRFLLLTGILIFLLLVSPRKISESYNDFQKYTPCQPKSVRDLEEEEENFRSRRWGSSLTVCARLTVRSSPHRNEWKFSGASVCRVNLKHLPQPLRSHIKFRIPRTTFENTPLCMPKYSIVQG
jgi:hypothetical protein